MGDIFCFLVWEVGWVGDAFIFLICEFGLFGVLGFVSWGFGVGFVSWGFV